MRIDFFWQWSVRLLHRPLAVTALMMLLLLTPIRSAGLAQESVDLNDPYVAAAAATGVPLDLLVAIAGAESAYHPWALNFGGKQIYCKSREEAEDLLSRSNNVDIGVMQVNWLYWGRQLGLSKLELLDPRTNILAGARILQQCLGRGDDELWKRIGRYHSAVPRERDRYASQVYRAYLRYRRGAMP